MVECFASLGADSDVRAIVISGRGKLFTGGLDVAAVMKEVPEFFDTSIEIARRGKRLGQMVRDFQQSFTQIEQVRGILLLTCVSIILYNFIVLYIVLYLCCHISIFISRL